MHAHTHAHYTRAKWVLVCCVLAADSTTLGDKVCVRPTTSFLSNQVFQGSRPHAACLPA